MNITVFSQPGCQPCRLVKKRLNDAGIPFEDVNLAEDEVALDFVTNALEATAVPVIFTDDRDPIFGFRPDQLAELIHDYVYEEDEE